MRMAVVAVSLLAAASLLPAAGCGRKEPAQRAPVPPPVTAGAPAPPATPVAAERAVLDDEVRKHWQAVEVLVHDKQPGGSEKKVRVAIGSEMAVAGTPLTVRVLGFVPDFAMGTDSVTTKSMKDVNPAVKVEVLEGGKTLFKGWAFRDFPDMHSFEDPRYTITMTRAVAAGG